MFERLAGTGDAFLLDVQTQRDSSRAVLSKGAPALGRQNANAILLLQSLLAAEIVCVMRYTLLTVSEEGLKNPGLATEFQAQANDERRHMAMLAARIEALGGVPDYRPAGVKARIAALAGGEASFAARLLQNLAAEQCVVEHYRELAAYFGRHDPETAAMLLDILQDEEDHTSDMQDLLGSCAK